MADCEIDGQPAFWTRIFQSTEQKLGLDYDGTLAPFRVDRHAAHPLPGTVELLETISRLPSTELAIVSGRPVAELTTFLSELPVLLIGSHGVEWRRPGDEIELVGLPNGAGELLTKIARETSITFPDLARQDKIERKGASVAVHVRGIEPARAKNVTQQLLHSWPIYTKDGAFEVREFNGGVEIRVKGVDKGMALNRWLGDPPEDSLRRAEVYLGDDDTDEDAFKVLRERGGIGIKVGDATGSAAKGALKGCPEVLKFLESWVECLKGNVR